MLQRRQNMSQEHDFQRVQQVVGHPLLCRPPGASHQQRDCAQDLLPRQPGPGGGGPLDRQRVPHGGVRLRVPDGVHQPGAALRSLLPTRISIQTRQVRIIRLRAVSE